MPECEFSADYYADGFFQEIREVYGHGLPYFFPSRVLAPATGFDAAVYNQQVWKLNIHGREVDSHLLRGLLPVQRRAILPNAYISLFLNFRTPFFVSTSRSRDPETYLTWKERGHRGYYRTDLDPEEVSRLQAWEEGVGEAGIVLQAAPAHHRHLENDIHQAAGVLLQETHFQSPSNLYGQDYYSYAESGTEGIAYPDGRAMHPANLLETISFRQSEGTIESFVLYLSRLWSRFIRLPDVEMLITDEREDFLQAARETLGRNAGLPIDPISLLGKQDVSFPLLEPVGSGVPNLETYGAAVLAIQRICRDLFDCRWIVFYS